MAVKSVLDRLISSRDIQFSTLLHVQTRRMLLDFVVNLCVTVTVLTLRSPTTRTVTVTDSYLILSMKKIIVRGLFKIYLLLQFLSESKIFFTHYSSIYTSKKSCADFQKKYYFKSYRSSKLKDPITFENKKFLKNATRFLWSKYQRRWL